MSTSSGETKTKTKCEALRQSYNSSKEGNVLFNNELNTFYLRLYGVRHMVKDHSDSEMETRCRHMVRAFTHGVMGHRIDPSLWTH